MNLRVKLSDDIIRLSKPLDEAARYLAARDFAQAKQFARLATDCRDEATRLFWRTAASDVLTIALRWLQTAKGEVLHAGR